MQLLWPTSGCSGVALRVVHGWWERNATTQHHAVRDVYFDFCERARLRPVNEALHSLLDSFTCGGQCRPTDILCIPALVLAQVLHNGARAIRTEPVCLDIAVICALGQHHQRHTAVGMGSGADAHITAKAARNDVSNKRFAAGAPLLADCSRNRWRYGQGSRCCHECQQ